jgi:uncharacterized protein (TIRG00374 family)
MKFRWFLWLLVVAFIWLIISRFAEIEILTKTLRQGRWQWVLLAVSLQIIYHILYASLYQSAFYAVEVQSKLLHLLKLSFVSVFINTIAPTAGSASVAMYMNDAARNNQSQARATAGTLLVSVADFCAFALLLLVGIVYLFINHELKIYEITGAVILLLLTSGQAIVLVMGYWKPNLLRRILELLERSANRLSFWVKHVLVLRKDWAENNSADFTDSAKAIGSHPKRMIRIIGFALAEQIANLACLYTLFQAFQHPIGSGMLVAGYAMGILFLNVSPIPQGIGVVEGTMTLVFTSLGIQSGAALVIIIAFRGLTLWLPLIIGFFLMRFFSSPDLRNQS